MIRALTIVAALVLAGAAYAQEATEEEKNACRDDFNKYCSTVSKDDSPAILACLKQNFAKLADQCKKAVEKR